MHITENKRLKEVQILLGFKSQSEFASVLGIKQGSLSDIYREKQGVKVSDSIKRVLEKEYSINIEWLETGEGEMLKSTVENTNQCDAQEQGDSQVCPLADILKEVLEALKSITDTNSELVKQQSALIDTIKTLVEKK